MFFARQFTRLFARLLIAALLLQIALPSWAAFGAGGASSKAGWMEICAAGGIQWVKVSQPGPSDSPVAAEHQSGHEHCLLCAATGAAPEFNARHHLHSSLRDEQIAASPAPAHRWYAGHSILSRAPPV